MADVPKVPLSSGAQIPMIGLGMFLTKDECEVRSTLSAALDAGYRHLDTAFTYRNEAFIGRTLQDLLKERNIQREQLFITTKLPPNGLASDAVGYFFQKSLSDLRLEYVDLYLLHFPVACKRSENDYDFFPMKNGVFDADSDVDLVQTWKAMEKLVESGRARSIGLSNCNSQQIRRIFEAASIKPAVLQVECHAYLPQTELLKVCQELGVALTAYSPIGAPGQAGLEGQKRLIDDERLLLLCQKHNKTPAQILLRYLVQRGIVVIPKSTNPKRLLQNIQIFDYSLTDDDMAIMKGMQCNRRYFTFETYTGIMDHPEYPFKIPY